VPRVKPARGGEITLGDDGVCVATTAASTGVVIPDGDGILTANDANDFASHVVRLLREGDLRTAMARKARAAVEANYQWATQLAALDRVIAALSPRQVPAVSLEHA
jgi:glycosyltransferase involved in cell wall biosynthesis